MTYPIQPPDPPRPQVTCRGSYRLGSACGRCARCEAELLNELRRVRDSTQCQCRTQGPCPHEVARQILLHKGM